MIFKISNFIFICLNNNVDCFNGIKALQHDKWARLNPYLVPKPAITYIVTEKGSERLNLQSAWDAKRGERAEVDAKSYNISKIN